MLIINLNKAKTVYIQSKGTMYLLPTGFNDLLLVNKKRRTLSNVRPYLKCIFRKKEKLRKLIDRCCHECFPVLPDSQQYLPIDIQQTVVRPE